ncbi:MAG: LytR/AlgR family response regulator transcription factor [Cellulosilyticaceae bacterium]
MFKIAVCEDEKIFQEYMIRLLEEYFEDVNKTFKVDRYSNGEALLSTNHTCYDIVFLDVEMYGYMDGITVARQLRKTGNHSQIIFITSHQEEAYKAFEVEAFRYLLKPINKKLLYETMGLLLQKCNMVEKEYIVFNHGKDLIRLNQEEVVYIETEKRRLKVCTKEDTYIVDNRINEVAKMLSSEMFFRAHKSYIINLSYIKEYTDDQVKLSNESIFYISRLKVPSFKKAFLDYLKEEGYHAQNML